jgi:hypothetical protein
VLALMDTRILQCDLCQRFFADPSTRHVKYCSPTCRNQVAVLHYRERHPDRYRTYQRDLMRARSQTHRRPRRTPRATTSAPPHRDGEK